MKSKSLSERRTPYDSEVHMITTNDQYVKTPVGESTEVKIGKGSLNAKLWLTRG